MIWEAGAQGSGTGKPIPISRAVSTDSLQKRGCHNVHSVLAIHEKSLYCPVQA